ncbi:MAG: phosphoglycerate mutase family protein [Bdellovibrionota bacterium]
MSDVRAKIIEAFLAFSDLGDPTIQILLYRHGHRDQPWGSEGDNGLSGRGLAQRAEWQRNIREMIASPAFTGTSWTPRLFSSPKIRCRETLEAWTESFREARIEIDPRLDEQSGVPDQIFFAQVREFLKSVSTGSLGNRIVACSHGDWIPVFVEVATGQKVNLGTAGCVLIKFGGRDSAELLAVVAGI